MTTTVSSNYNGEASSGTIPDGNDGLVPLGVSVISYGSGSHALVGNTSHSVKVMGTVFGDYLGIELGVSGALDNQYKDMVSVYSQGSVYGGFRAIYLSGAKNIISNFGNISSDHQSIVAKNSNPGGFLIIKNYGDIVNQPDDGGSALSVDGGIHLDLRNFGNITSYGGTSIVTNGGNGDLLYNRGTIEGDIHLGSASAHVTNRGLITGDITFSSGTNYLDNRGGTIEGAISFGTGADTFSPGAGIETANGGDGIDTLDFTRSTAVQIALDNSIIATGNDAKDDNYTGFENIIGSYSGNDLLIGDGQDNAINGLNGADKLYGQAGNDTLNGNRGDDLVDGGEGDDNVNGGFGNDTLFGGIDRDTLSGGDGNDFLTGGEGADVLTGGSGLDVFIYLKTDLRDKRQVDRITDFSQTDHDLIDLSAVDANSLVIDDQAFKFIGSENFHRVAGELRFQTDPKFTNITDLSGDTNGDGKPDFVIMLDGLVTLTAQDFIL